MPFKSTATDCSRPRAAARAPRRFPGQSRPGRIRESSSRRRSRDSECSLRHQFEEPVKTKVGRRELSDVPEPARARRLASSSLNVSVRPFMPPLQLRHPGGASPNPGENASVFRNSSGKVFSLERPPSIQSHTVSLRVRMDDQPLEKGKVERSRQTAAERSAYESPRASSLAAEFSISSTIPGESSPHPASGSDELRRAVRWRTGTPGSSARRGVP